MKKARITHISKKKEIKLMFRQEYTPTIFYTSHNPFLQHTEYEIHIENNQYPKNPYQALLPHFNTISVVITVSWGENGYKYITLKRLGSMIMKQFPELLV